MTATALRSLALDKLTPDPDQVRQHFDKAGLKTLADNLKARGVLQPILAREVGKKLIIVDGERRWRAAKLAKLKTVPVMVMAAGDDVQRKLDQVAVNSLREGLKPLELGRLLVGLRQKHKLSDNQIAAHLDKQGIPALSKSQMAELMQLVDLPEWAQGMVDAGELEPKAAPHLIRVKQDPKVASAVEKQLHNKAGMGRFVDASDAARTVQWKYSELAAANLNNTQDWHTNPVLFDPKTACKGCEHLRVVGDQRFCMDGKHFNQLQKEAKEAGLGPGGKKPAKQTAQAKGAATRADNAEQERKAEQKEKSRGERLADHLDRHLRRHLDHAVLGNSPELQQALRHYMLAGMPHGKGWDGEPALLLGSYSERKQTVHLEKAVAQAGLTDLIAFVTATPEQLLQVAKASQSACLQMLRRDQVHALARHLQLNLDTLYRIDEEYLRIHSKAELQKLAEIGGLEDPHKRTVMSCVEDILASELAIKAIGVPADIRAVYDAEPVGPPVHEPRASLGDVVCIGCGCFEEGACEDEDGEPCYWLEREEAEGVGVCSGCRGYLDAREKGERRTPDEREADDE